MKLKKRADKVLSTKFLIVVQTFKLWLSWVTSNHPHGPGKKYTNVKLYRDII